MIIVVIRVKVKPDQVLAFQELTFANAQDRADSAGNLRFEVYQQAEDPTHFVMIEVFQTQADIDAYYATASYQSWHAATAEMIIDLTGNDYVQVFSKLEESLRS